MAKKGGTSEINGFVSIKTDDGNKTRQKISTRTAGPVTDIKSNTSKSSIKEKLNEAEKSVKLINKVAVGNKTKLGSNVTKVINKDIVEKKTKRESSINKVVSKNVIESKTNHEGRVSKVVNKDVVKNKTKQESVAKVSQSSKNITPNPKNRVNVNTSKTNEPSSKAIIETTNKNPVVKGKNEVTASKRLPTEKKISNRPIVAEDISKSKRSTKPAERGTSIIASKSSEKVQRSTSNNTKFKSISKDSFIKEKKNELENSKTEASKKSSFNKKTERNETAERNVALKSSISTKNGNVLMKQNSVKQPKSYTIEKDAKSLSKKKVTNQEYLQDVNISEISNIQMELPKDDETVKNNYKDMIYFEVDMVDSKRSTERVQSARIKSATSQPRPVTRQGTFTKDESLNYLESEVKETSVEEHHTETQDNSEEIEYEDDFEDYESDFEEYVSESESESGLSSKSETDSQKDEIKPSMKTEPMKVLKSVKKVVEEERKLDSGNYDLSSKTVFPSSIKQKQLDLIKEAISQENISLFEKSLKFP
ncbi:unnamed protein product [Nezara viridula]|uniref:Uncharacterized protein n=1 Tax=Nezara viridula TaxID=85310 RepID=A0A9P0H2E8_NEZVI|nr:unnamed protein product [Nezara viridula]